MLLWSPLRNGSWPPETTTSQSSQKCQSQGTILSSLNEYLMNFGDLPQHKQLDRLRRTERCIEQSRFSSRFSMQGCYPTFQKQSWHPCQLPTHCISSVSPARSTAITQSIRYKKWPCNHINIHTHVTPSRFLPPGSLKKMCLIYFQTSYIGAVRPTPSCYPGPRSRWHHCVRSKATPLHQPVSVTKQAASELLGKTDFCWRTLRFNHQRLSFRYINL